MTATPMTDQPADTSVRKASPDDVTAMVEVLTRAFDHDPVVNWFVRQDAERAQALARFFDIAVRDLTLPLGEVYTTAGGTGAALWAPPGTWELGPDDIVPLLPDLRAVFGEGQLERSLEGMAAMDAVHPREPHLYLWLLGVAPELHGRGIGSALLQTVLRRCDAQDLPAYLEATNPRNVALYQRHGFVVTDTITLPDDGPPLWLMWRDPQPTPATRRRNGIDLGQLHGVVGALGSQPGAGTVTIRTRQLWDDAFAVDGQAETIEAAGQALPRDHTFRIDWPRVFGGMDSGPSSGESLLATLGACVAQSYAIRAALEGVEIDELAVDVEGRVELEHAFADEPQAGVSGVSVTVVVHSGADDAALDRLGTAVRSASPVLASLASPVPVELSVQRLP